MGDSSPASTTSRPVTKSAARFQSARSGLPRRRRRSQPWKKRMSASSAGTSTEAGALQAACATSTELEPEQLADHHALHLVRAFADLQDLLVAVEPRDRVLLHETVAAVDLQRRVCGAVREQAGVELRLCGGEAEVLALILQPRGAVDELAPRLYLRRHVGERELHRLELRDRPAELLALLRVRERKVVRALCEPDAHRRDGDAAAVEDLHELLEALPSRAEQVPFRHGAVLERQLARVGGMPAE